MAPSGAGEVICQGFLLSISRDGRLGVVYRADPDGSSLLAEVVDLAGGSDPIGLGTSLELKPGMNPGATFADISPDNRWALVPTNGQGRSTVVVVSTKGESPGLPVIAQGATAAWFSESGETIYFTKSSEALASPFTNATEIWRVAWQPEPEPALGTPERIFVLEDPVLVTGFDHKRDRFLASWKQTSGKHRIPARTGWSGGAESR